MNKINKFTLNMLLTINLLITWRGKRFLDSLTEVFGRTAVTNKCRRNDRQKIEK